MRAIFIFTQISLCLASSGPKITAESDQGVLDPFIDNFQPTMTHLPGQGTHSSVVAISLPSSTATPRPTTISWSWWRITNIARRESIGLKPPTSMPTSSPSPSKSSVQPSTVTVTAINTMTNVPVDASTKSPSQLHREEMGKELKRNNKIMNWAQILIGFIG
jgi:hypothetical protein